MLYPRRHSGATALPGRPGRRPGRISAVLIFSLPLLAVVFALALNSGTLNEVRTYLRTSADSAALAAAQALVDDRTLADNPSLYLEIIEAARAAANEYIEKNPVPGGPVPVRLKDNPENKESGDVVFGALAKPRDKTFYVQPLDATDPDFLRLINTVRVTARRTKERGNPTSLLLAPGMALTSADVTVAATATLDPWVIGLRPTKNHPIPLAPIALLSDPTGKNEQSWQWHVERKNGPDAFHVERIDKKPVIKEDGDGLHEMLVTLKPQGSSQPSNAILLQLGVEDCAGLALQLAFGVTKEQLKDFKDQFVMAADGKGLVVPGSGCAPGGQESGQLQTALQRLQSLAEPRVWPLYSQIDPETGMPVITGFVAARVAQVTGGADGSLSFLLQPCRMSTGTAVTDPEWPGFAGAPLGNLYVCRVRLVE